MRMLSRAVPTAVLCTAVSRAACGQVLHGRIVDAASQHEVPDATISIVGDPATARSDSAGRFTLVLHRPGTVVLIVRRLGYEMRTWRFDLATADTADATLPLPPVTRQLDTVSINAPVIPPSNVAAFERRRSQRAGGIYITRAEIGADPPTQTADLLRRVPTVEVRQKGMRTVVVSRRGPVSVVLTPDLCVVPLARDGLVLGPNYSLNDIPANEIYGIEIYSGPATIPAEFRGALPNGVCGLVMIWTRSGVTEAARRP